MLQCAAVRCSVLQRAACVAASCSVLHCAAFCCRVLQCVAVCCSVLQCVAMCCTFSPASSWAHEVRIRSSYSVKFSKVSSLVIIYSNLGGEQIFEKILKISSTVKRYTAYCIGKVIQSESLVSIFLVSTVYIIFCEISQNIIYTVVFLVSSQRNVALQHSATHCNTLF